jgi:hypothetical protein
MPRGPSPKKLKQWTARLKRFEASNQTVVRFCQVEGVSQPSFYQWKKKLASQAGRSGLADKPNETRGGFRPVEISSPVAAAIPTSKQSGATIRLARDIAIELGSDLRVVESIVQQLLDSLSETPLPGDRSC